MYPYWKLFCTQRCLGKNSTCKRSLLSYSGVTAASPRPSKRTAEFACHRLRRLPGTFGNWSLRLQLFSLPPWLTSLSVEQKPKCFLEVQPRPSRACKAFQFGTQRRAVVHPLCELLITHQNLAHFTKTRIGRPRASMALAFAAPQSAAAVLPLGPKAAGLGPRS